MKLKILIGMLLFSLELFAQTEETVTLTANFDECAAAKINKFQNEGTGKVWKVVIGRNIEYGASKPNTSTWDWKLGKMTTSGTFEQIWNFNAITPSTFSRKGVGRIPKTALLTTSLMPTDNSLFGELVATPVPPTLTNLNGIVNVSRAGNIDLNSGTNQVKVYYEKDVINNNLYMDPNAPSGTPGQTVPNWFYYWSKSSYIQDLLTLPGIDLYNIPGCTFTPAVPVGFQLIYDETSVYNSGPGASNSYGACSFNSHNWNKEDTWGTCTPSRIIVDKFNDGSIISTKITIGKACGYKKGKELCNASAGNYEGIHTLYATVIHEREHAVISSEVWQYTHVSEPTITAGYDTAWDQDLDGYKDLWETHHTDYSMFIFTIASDKYEAGYQGCFCQFKSDGTPNTAYPCKMGTMYEETRCRDKEAAATLTDIDKHDWSHDPTNKVQGKQWD